MQSNVICITFLLITSNLLNLQDSTRSLLRRRQRFDELVMVFLPVKKLRGATHESDVVTTALIERFVVWFSQILQIGDPFLAIELPSGLIGAQQVCVIGEQAHWQPRPYQNKEKYDDLEAVHPDEAFNCPECLIREATPLDRRFDVI